MSWTQYFNGRGAGATGRSSVEETNRSVPRFQANGGRTPLRWNPDYMSPDTRNPRVPPTPNYRGLETIVEDMAVSDRQAYPRLSTNSDDSYSTNFTSLHSSVAQSQNGYSRRHSDGDLLELTSPGARYSKNTPVKQNANRQLFRQTSAEQVRTPRKKSYGGTESPRDFDAYSDVSGRSRLSIASEESLTSASKLAGRRRSEPDGMRKTLSTTSLVKNDQRRKSSAGTESVAGSDRRSSIANGVDSPKTVPDRRLSTLSLADAGPSAFSQIEIPLELIESPQSRVRKMMTPIIVFVIVVALLASLSAAIYFAVVLKDSQEKQIEFLQATLKLSVARGTSSRDYSSLTLAQFEEFKAAYCRQVDDIYRVSTLQSGYRGCELSSLTNDRVEFKLYFSDKGRNEKEILDVLTLRSQPVGEQGQQLIKINDVTVDISKNNREVTLDVTKKSEDFYGADSPELKRSNTQFVTSAHVIAVQKTPPTVEYVTETTTAVVWTKPRVEVVAPPTTPSTTNVPATTSAASETVVVPTTSTTAALLSQTSTAATTKVLVKVQVTTTTTTPTPLVVTSSTTKAAAAAVVLAPTTTKATTTTKTTTSAVVNPVLNYTCEDGVEAHPTSCTQYIQCNFGQPIPRPCSGGLVFDPSSKACVFPNPDAPCLTLTPCDDINGGYFRHPNNCSLFIICDHGQTVVQSCSESLAWDSDKNSCVPRNSTDCSQT